MKKFTKYILVSMVALFATILIVKAAPSINILGNRAVVGPGLNSTTTANGHFTASGTIAFVSLGSSGNPCLTIGTDGTLATSTCGGGTVYISSSTPFTAGYIPFATSSISITNSNIFQLGSNIGIGTTTPSFLLEILGDLKINTSSTLGNVISGVWNGTAIGDSYISSATNWNSKATSTLNLTTGAGLTGGGNLTADRTFTVGAGTGITVNADTIDNSGVLSLGTATGTITLQSPLVMTSNVLSMPTSTTAVNGYLSATDWTTFNSKGIINSLSGISTSTISLTASSSIGLSTTTNGINIGAKNYPIQFIIENPTASENDNIFIFNTTSTITKVLAVNKSASDTITFGLGYSTSQATATSSLTNLFPAETITSTSTPVSITLTTASSTPGLHNVLKFWTTAASSTQFTISIFYSEN